MQKLLLMTKVENLSLQSANIVLVLLEQNTEFHLLTIRRQLALWNVLIKRHRNSCLSMFRKSKKLLV